MTTRRAIAALLLAVVALLAAARPARADDATAAAIPARARTLAAEDPAAAADLLRELLGRDDATPDVLALGARAALDDLPVSTGDGVAADLVLAALRKNRTHPVAWRTAFAVIDTTWSALDLPVGERFLDALLQLYPDYVLFRSRLADLYAACGRPRQARAEYEHVLREVPDDTDARDRLAFYTLLDGDPRGAVALHEKNIAVDGSLRAHLYRIQILWETLGDYDAAERALFEAFKELDLRPPGEVRARFRADLEAEAERMREYRKTRDDLLAADSRLDLIIAATLGAWVLALGIGVFVRRRRPAV